MEAPIPIFDRRGGHCGIVEVRGVIHMVKFGLQEFQIVPRFEIRMRLPVVYWMSDDGINQRIE